MFASEFEAVCSKIPVLNEHFQGCFARSTLKTIKKNKFCLWNDTDGIGSHWRIIMRMGTNMIEVFDPLGIQADKIVELLSPIDKKSFIIFNSTQIQPSHSSLCGYFCLMYIFLRLVDYDLEQTEILNEDFSSTDLVSNENKVLAFLKEYNLT